MSRPKPVAAAPELAAAGGGGLLSRSLGSSWRDLAPIARASLERDLEDEEQEEEEEEEQDGEEDSSLPSDEDEAVGGLLSSSAPAARRYSLYQSYRRNSFVGNRARMPVEFGSTARGRGSGAGKTMSKVEQKAMLEEERSLLRDNNLIPPKHARGPEGDRPRRKSWYAFPIPGGDGRVGGQSRDVNVGGVMSERAPLMGDPNQPYGGQADSRTISTRWEEAVKEGKIQTTWQREAKVLSGYAFPLMATFLLQYSLTVASVFVLGHIGATELGAVSLASMTANITGYAIYQGLATSLDTLAPQAYGSGKKKLVGLQMQRMIYFLWAVTIPIAIIWLLADRILMAIVPEKEVAKLAGLYLKIVLIGAPGYAAFEAGKRYVQAQGEFSASLYVLMVLSPFNAFLNWFLVWKLNLGFIGAPIAVAITDNCLPLGLFIYVRFFSKNGMSCWNGFTKKAFHNWDPMVKLALPGVVMVEAEVLAFEILTFAASYYGVEVLAAQSILATLTNITFQIPFPLSIAASTRVANLIGATLVDAAKLTTKVAFFGAFLIGIFNVILLSSLRNYIPRLFTSDEEVVRLTSAVLPLCAAFQLFDALTALCNGVLRGIGRQHFGGYVQLFCYYVIAMPISFGTTFGLNWGLWGLWTGVAIALGLVFVVEFVYLSRTDWSTSVEEARLRNIQE
jgi:MATE family multidrug resistance protein